MAMSCILDDLDTLFASSDFGEANGAIRNGETANPIDGIFDDEDVETQNGEGVTVLVPQTTFQCASSKVPNLSNGDNFYIRQTNYVCRFWMDDGSGVTTIYMERITPSEVVSPPDSGGDLILSGGDADLIISGGDASA